MQILISLKKESVDLKCLRISLQDPGSQSLMSISHLCSVKSNTLQPHGPLCPFSWQEYWSEFPCHLQGNLPDPEMDPVSPALQVVLYY